MTVHTSLIESHYYTHTYTKKTLLPTGCSGYEQRPRLQLSLTHSCLEIYLRSFIWSYYALGNYLNWQMKKICYDFRTTSQYFTKIYQSCFSCKKIHKHKRGHQMSSWYFRHTWLRLTLCSFQMDHQPLAFFKLNTRYAQPPQ